MEKIPQKQENSLEKENFEPQIIFDFIRHGEAEYGPELKRKFIELGFDWDKLMSASKITKEEIKEPASLEGRLTPEGKVQLRGSISGLVEKIDKDNENIMVLYSPRFRAVDSTNIILEELERQGVDVFKAREHNNLIDMKKHWISILEFVKEKEGEKKEPFRYWLNMSEQELKDADLEGFKDVGQRIDHFIQLIKRYFRVYKDKLNLDKKKLRVVAVTHDMNILSALKKEGATPEEADLIKNADIVELGIDKEGNRKLIFKQ